MYLFRCFCVTYAIEVLPERSFALCQSPHSTQLCYILLLSTLTPMLINEIIQTILKWLMTFELCARLNDALLNFTIRFLFWFWLSSFFSRSSSMYVIVCVCSCKWVWVSKYMLRMGSMYHCMRALGVSCTLNISLTIFIAILSSHPVNLKWYFIFLEIVLYIFCPSVWATLWEFVVGEYLSWAFYYSWSMVFGAFFLDNEIWHTNMEMGKKKENKNTCLHIHIYVKDDSKNRCSNITHRK